MMVAAAMQRLVCMLWLALSASALNAPEELVSLLMGNGKVNSRTNSIGNTQPLVAWPWGFNHWQPQNGGRDNIHYQLQDKNRLQTTHIRCTHQPSRWIGDWDSFTLSMPKPMDAVELTPYNMKLSDSDGTIMELVPTDHCAVVRAKLAAEGQVCTNEFTNWMSTEYGNHEFMRFTVRNDNVYQRSSRPTLYVIMEVLDEKTMAPNTNLNYDARHGCFNFEKDSVYQLRIATSLISFEQAAFNFDTELSDNQHGEILFEDLRTAARMTWRKEMLRTNVIVSKNEETYARSHSNSLSIFYTCVYRTMLFPRNIHEPNPAGGIHHWSAYDGKGGVYTGEAVTDNGFWDTHRALFPLLGLVNRDRLAAVTRGYLAGFEESGKLASGWVSAGVLNSMVGTYGSVSIADAVVKNVEGFDVRVAVGAMLQDTVDHREKRKGSPYDKHGYIPYEKDQDNCVSKSQDFGYSDYAVAKALLYICEDSMHGDQYKNECPIWKKTAQELLERSRKPITKLYNPNRKLMNCKSISGEVRPKRFNPIDFGCGFVEGNAYHYAFPPYDMDLLAETYGGYTKLKERMTEVLTVPQSEVSHTTRCYGETIHEMLEHKISSENANSGQYSHSNQPTHHILYTMILAGDRRLAEKLISRVMGTNYNIDAFPGDEDNGATAAWYVLSALGLYSVQLGTPNYVLGAPIFDHVIVQLQDNRELHIERQGTGVHTRGVALNGADLGNAFLHVSDDVLQKGGILTFSMFDGSSDTGKVNVVDDHAGGHHQQKNKSPSPNEQGSDGRVNMNPAVDIGTNADNIDAKDSIQGNPPPHEHEPGSDVDTLDSLDLDHDRMMSKEWTRKNQNAPENATGHPLWWTVLLFTVAVYGMYRQAPSLFRRLFRTKKRTWFAMTPPSANVHPA